MYILKTKLESERISFLGIGRELPDRSPRCDLVVGSESECLVKRIGQFVA